MTKKIEFTDRAKEQIDKSSLGDLYDKNRCFSMPGCPFELIP